MKSMIRVLMSAMMVVAIGTHGMAQKIDDERMNRDLAVAENVLSTLIKQQFNNQRTFFPLEVTASYQAGYGVTFTLPADYTTPIAYSTYGNGSSNVVIWGDSPAAIGGVGEIEDERAAVSVNSGQSKKIKLKEKGKGDKSDLDSIRDAYNLKVVEAAKEFMLDYSDMISQLGAQERIVVTNQGNQPRQWVGKYFNSPTRTHLSIEATKADMSLFRQGKMNRSEASKKITVVNTESSTEIEPDLELLSSIFTRLYRSDLSKTYFTEDNIYYERMKDFGVIYYMQAFSGVEREYRRFDLPTLNLSDVDLETRNKKVTELYPKFEQELKENVLEYGRTIKSLKDNEQLIFQVKITRCTECGIPSTLEVSVNGSTLKDFNAGKIEKKAALSKFVVKKGANQ